MQKVSHIDYTARARNFVARYPLLSTLLTHINFWVAAYILLVVIFYFSRRQLITSFSLPVDISLGPPLLNALIIGIIYGAGNGLLDYFFDSRMFRNKPLGKLIILKAIISLGLMISCFALLRYVLFDLIIAPSLRDTQ